jgi:tripartite ATP-independent transporter DctM subunit
MLSMLTIVIAALLILLGVPILFAIAVGAILAISLTGDASLLVVVQRMFQSANIFPIVAVPLFMLAGEVMNRGGLSQRIIHLSSRLIGHVPGSTALSATLASMLFAAISGSASATSAAIGSIMIPAMIRARFQRAFATAVQAFSASTGVIIPPSITLIIYGALAGVSIGQLFAASIIPGLLAGIAMMAVSYNRARIEKLPTEPFAGWKESGRAFRGAFWALLMPIVILGGIFSGRFTPTEAAAVAVLYGLVIGLFIHRELKLADMRSMFTDAALKSSIPVLLFCVAGVLNYIFNLDRLPQTLAEQTMALTSNPLIFLLLINVFLFILGMLMESSATLVVLTPILAPLAASYGIDLVHFGVLMNLNLAIGQATPPIGSTLFISCTISKTDIGEMFRPSIPFLVAAWIVLLLVTYCEPVSMIGVRLLSGG